MSAYVVVLRPDGSVLWFEQWMQLEMPDDIARRPATEAEAALMSKVVWKLDMYEDRKCLLEMLTANPPCSTPSA